MRRLEWTFLAVLLSVVVGGLLFRAGGFYQGNDRDALHLQVEKPPPQTLKLGEDAVFDLQGQGFDRDTRAHLVMDISNDDMIVNRYPLTGHFNVSLVVDDLLFLGSNSGLKVLTLADEASPRLLDEYLDGRPVLGLQRSGDYLFVACGRFGVVIMEIKGAQLTYVTDIWIADLVIDCLSADGMLFVASSTRGLLVYDLTQPTRPVPAQQLSLDTTIRDMAAYGSCLYLLTREDRIRVFAFSGSDRLRPLATLDLPDHTRSITIFNDALFIAMNEGLWQYSLDQPQHPRPVRRWNQFTSLATLQNNGSTLYAVDGYLSFRALSGTPPELAEAIQFPQGLRTIADSDNYLYVTGNGDGLLTVAKDRMRPRQVVRTFEVPTSSIRSAVLADGRLFLSGSSGLFMVDTRRMNERPVLVDPEQGITLARMNGHLFVSQTHHSAPVPADSRPLPKGTPLGIKVYDIRTPEEPAPVADWPHLFASRMAVAGRYLLATGASGLTVIDPEDPARPVVADRLSDLHVISLTVDGAMLYLITRQQGLLIYSLDARGKLSLRGTLERPFPLKHFDEQLDVQVSDGVAYIANGRSGVLMVDVEVPEKPRVMGSIDVPGYSKGVQLHDHQLFVITLRDGVSIVDIDNKNKPLLVGHLPISRITRYALFDNGLLYFFQDQKGVSAIPLPIPAQELQPRGSEGLRVRLPSPAYPGRYSLQISCRNEVIIHYGVVEYQ